MHYRNRARCFYTNYYSRLVRETYFQFPSCLLRCIPGIVQMLYHNKVHSPLLTHSLFAQLEPISDFCCHTNHCCPLYLNLQIIHTSHPNQDYKAEGPSRYSIHAQSNCNFCSTGQSQLNVHKISASQWQDSQNISNLFAGKLFSSQSQHLQTTFKHISPQAATFRQSTHFFPEEEGSITSDYTIKYLAQNKIKTHLVSISNLKDQIWLAAPDLSSYTNISLASMEADS